MTKHTNTRDAYFSEARSWAMERNDNIRASRKIAWIVAIITTILALGLAIAIIMMLPLKTVVQQTLLVDRQTGYVQALNPIEKQRIAPDAALTQSLLVQYVVARESYDIATVQSDYKKVALWSVNPAKADYMRVMQADNPQSPLARLPRSSQIETRIRSVSPLGKDTALVRYETVLRDANSAGQVPQTWAAIVTYRFSTAPMAVEDRYINPLGFQVVRYRKSVETLPNWENISDRPAQSSLPPRQTAPTALQEQRPTPQ
jgi:type IV secretion system protein VirB8